MQQTLNEISVFLPTFTQASSRSCTVSFSGIEIGSAQLHHFKLPCQNTKESTHFVRSAGRGAAYRFAIIEEPSVRSPYYTVKILEKITLSGSTATIIGVHPQQTDLDSLYLDVRLEKG